MRFLDKKSLDTARSNPFYLQSIDHAVHTRSILNRWGPPQAMLHPCWGSPLQPISSSLHSRVFSLHWSHVHVSQVLSMTVDPPRTADTHSAGGVAGCAHASGVRGGLNITCRPLPWWWDNWLFNMLPNLCTCTCKCAGVQVCGWCNTCDSASVPIQVQDMKSSINWKNIMQYKCSQNNCP